MERSRLRIIFSVIAGVLVVSIARLTRAGIATSGEPWLFGKLTDLQTPMSVRVLLEEHGVETYTDCLDWTARNLTTQLGSLREIDQLVASRASAASEVMSLVSKSIAGTTSGTTSSLSSLGIMQNISLLVTLRSKEQRNRFLAAEWSRECAIAGGSLGTSLLQLRSGKLTNFSQVDEAVDTIKQCYSIGAEIIANIEFLAKTGCPLLSKSLLQDNAQIKSFCAPSKTEDELSLQFVLRLHTSTAIFSIDSQTTFLKLSGLAEKLLESYTYIDRSVLLNTTAGEQMRWLVCVSAFYQSVLLNHSVTSSASFSPMMLCSSICDNGRLLRDVMVNFVNLSSSLTTSIMNHAITDLCLDRSRVKDGHCFEVNPSGEVVVRSVAHIPPPKFCLNFTCKFPLIATTNRHHWFPSHQGSMQKLRRGLVPLFPSAALPFNGSRYPCGVACSTIYFTADEEKAMRTTRFVCGCIGIAFTLVAISAYLLNRETLQNLPRRLNFYLNMAFLLGPGIDSLLAVGTDSMKIVYCHADDTLRYNEPRDGVTLCVLLAAKFLYFSFMMGFLSLALCHEWIMAIKALLNSVSPWDTTKKDQNKRALIYVVGSMLGSAILTAVVVSRRSILGLPNTGGCLLRVKDQFDLFGIPLMVLTLVMIIYVFIGLRMLAKVYKGVFAYVSSLKGDNRRSVAQSRNGGRNSSNLAGLERLIHLLTLYIVLLFATQAIVLPTFIYRYMIEDHVLSISEEHHMCLSCRCDPSTCPSLHYVSPAVTIVPDVFLTLVGIVLSLWAFKWSVFFQSHFVRQKENLRQCRGKSSIQVNPPNGLVMRQAPSPREENSRSNDSQSSVDKDSGFKR